MGTPKELNENWGRNWGLDGFWHDMDYGHNTHVNVKVDPGHGAMSGIPGDLVASEEGEDGEDFAFDSSDLGDMGVTAALGAPLMPTEGVVDHHWLSDAQQDPARLPRIQDSLTQLQILWGDRTDGFFRVPATDRIEDVVRQKELRDAEKVGPAVQRAIRAYTMGKSEEDILPEIGEALWNLAAPFMKEAADDRGLLGNVYIYANAYPGLSQGEHAREYAQAKKRAKYLVIPRTVPKEAMAKVYAATGLLPVYHPCDIPWQTELLDRTGKTASEDGVARKLLAKHYLSEPVRFHPFDGQRTVVTTPQVSSEEAQRAFAAHTPKEAKVVSLQQREEAFQRRSVAAHLKRWAQNGLLPLEEVARLAKLPPSRALQKAAQLVLGRGQMRSGQYQAPQPHASEGVSQKTAYEALEAAKRFRDAEHLARWEARVKAAAAKDYQERRDVLQRMKKAGWISTEVQDRLLASTKPTREVLAEAEAIAATPKKAHPFSGRFHRHDPEVTPDQVEDALRVASEHRADRDLALQQRAASEVLASKMKRLSYILDQGTVGDAFVKEVRSSLTREEAREAWPILQPLLRTAAARTERSETPTYQGHLVQAHALQGRSDRIPVDLREIQRHLAEGMHKGLVGRALTASLASKVTLEDLRPHAEAIRSFRRAHEGRMGQTYIDAAHFAEGRGIRGCQEAASRPFATTTEGVLGMEDCRTCVAFDGTHGRCLTFQRPMIWDVPARAILPRQAKAAPTSNPVMDFGLQSSVDASLQDHVRHDKPDVEFGSGMRLR